MYELSESSIANLEGVKPELVSLVMRAIQLSEIQFEIFFDGTVHGHGVEAHLRQADRLSHAIDACPQFNGQASYTWEDIWIMTKAFQQAADDLRIASSVRWGGVWDRTLDKLGAPKAEMIDYRARAKRPLPDGLHFEWITLSPVIDPETVIDIDEDLIDDGEDGIENDDDIGEIDSTDHDPDLENAKAELAWMEWSDRS